MRVCGFYVIQATSDGVSLEKVHGAKKYVPWENIVRFSSVLWRHLQISCQGHNVREGRVGWGWGLQAAVGRLTQRPRGRSSGPVIHGRSVVHSVSAPLELRTFTEKNCVGCVSALVMSALMLRD